MHQKSNQSIQDTSEILQKNYSDIMSVKIIILLCAVTAVMAYPYANQQEYADLYEESPTFFEAGDLEEEMPLYRAKRQLQLNGGGGGSRGQGVGFGLQGSAPVWKSDNGRHQVDATGSYSQHLGGPYGSSRPNWGAGAVYSYKF